MSRETLGLTRWGIAILLPISMLSSSVFSQETFEPIPRQLAAHYHLDFARNFFASPEAERADRAGLFATLKDLEDLKGKVVNSAGDLERALQLYDRAQVQFYRHYSYLYLRHAVNTDDETSLTESNELDAEVRTRTAFLRQELMQVGDQAFAALVSRKPALKQYLFFLEAIRRFRPHTLSLKEEELLNATAPNDTWPNELYEKLRARTQVNSAGNSDSKARAEAFKQRWAALTSERDLYAFTLLRLAGAGTRLAELRYFQDAPSQVYFRSYWTRAEVDNLLEQVTQKADLYKRYQRIRADHAQRLTGAPEINIWDLGMRPPSFSQPRFTIEQAGRVIRAALAPLGTDYGQELTALLDPANGRMDIVPGPNRLSGGFSQGFIGTKSLFFSHGFMGTYNDVRVLTHESTHAVHRQLMSLNHVLPSYATGPGYLFEAFAIFNEFLLPDYLYSHETDPLRKQFYLEQFLEGKGTIMFVVAPEVAVEHAVYDGVKQGTIKGADDLDSLTRRIYSRYSIWPEKHDELKGQWMTISLMYQDPFYDVNYIYGSLLALKFYQMYKTDPAQFIPRYIALMRNGFDAPPAILLKRFLGIDLKDPRLISDALSVIGDKVNLLEKSFGVVAKTHLSKFKSDETNNP